ncbi:MAG: PfkB family carbohydrate kinase [Patescibacteria group bacterium]
MYDIVTIGDIKLDTFIVVPEASVMCELKMPSCKLCFDYGKKIPVEVVKSQIAGSAPNVAIGIAKMGKNSAIYSIMGENGNKALAIDFLTRNGVDARCIKTEKNREDSFAAVINYKGEATQLVSLGKVEYRVPKTCPKTEWLHVSELGSGYEKMYRDVIKMVKLRGTKISLNPSVVQIQERKKELIELLKYTSVLFLNFSEAKMLLRTEEKIEIHYMLAQLKSLGPKYVVVTAGSNGAYAFDGQQIDFVPVFPAKRIEATGAGDAFSTGFLGAIMHGKKHAEAVKWGSVNAASVIEHVGPTDGLLSHNQIIKRLRDRPSYKTKEL